MTDKPCLLTDFCLAVTGPLRLVIGHLMRSVLTIFTILLLAPAAAAAPAGDFHVSPDLREVLTLPEHGRTLVIMLILVQVAVVLVVAKLLGALCERIRVPGVIGELMAGVIIGPFLLGSLIQIPLHGHWVPLFPRPISPDQWPVNDVLWAMAQFASIILLFITGLHTDLKQFLRYVGPAIFVALVGIAAPFLLGVGSAYLPAFRDLAPAHPGQSVLVPALFLGAILAATSIGITARVLGDIQKLDTPEGVTILGAAVLDDVLGIIALAIVGGIAATGTISGGAVSIITIKAFGVWIGITGLILLLAKPIEKALTGIRYTGAAIGLGLALAFICSAIAEFFGLAFIIGAYSVGLGLSRTKLAHRLMDELQPIAGFIVPIFFAVLGMLVNFEAMFSDGRVVLFGLVVTAAAIVGKLVACGLAALPTGFNARGAYRIGLGMMPRGEVALIVAGIGLSRNIIGTNVFGVSILMTLITTILAPILLVPAFKGGSGRREAEPSEPSPVPAPPKAELSMVVPRDMSELLAHRLLSIAEAQGWQGSYERADEEVYLLRSDEEAAQISIDEDGTVRVDVTGGRGPEFARFLQQARESIHSDLQRFA